MTLNLVLIVDRIVRNKLAEKVKLSYSQLNQQHQQRQQHQQLQQQQQQQRLQQHQHQQQRQESNYGLRSSSGMTENSSVNVGGLTYAVLGDMQQQQQQNGAGVSGMLNLLKRPIDDDQRSDAKKPLTSLGNC